MFYDEDHDYSESDQQEMKEESVAMKTVGALFLLVLVIALATCASQPFQDKYEQCIAGGKNTTQCAQE